MASTSVRVDGSPPHVDVVPTGELIGRAVQVVVEMRRRHRSTGLIAPERLHVQLANELATVGLGVIQHVQAVGTDDVPLFSPEAVKGLEFDGVVVVNPAEVFDGSARGARLLYVAMTRAVQDLHLVGDRPLPV